MFTVFVEGLEFYAYHGVAAEERALGHRFVVDLEMEVEGDADETDELAGTVDYAEAARQTVELCRKEQYLTLERLARVVAEGLLERQGRLRSVRVRLAKRLPPADLMVEEVGVELERRRR
jgi:7,8-dihydroneopterin aldolase/epimerase/oxygenase